MKAAALYGVLVALVSALFLLAPGVDLTTGALLYTPRQAFLLAGWWPVRLLEGSIPWITRLIFVLAAIGAGWLLLTGRPLWRLDRKALVFIVAATAVGPGLIVNTVLKDHWGRARPFQVAEFGGTQHFTPAPLPAIECDHNCAFVSGHAALGFSLIGFAFLLPPGRKRQVAIAAALGFGGLVGLARMASGGHFLSDVIFAGLIVFAVSWLLYRWIVVHDALGSPGAIRFYRGLGARLAVNDVQAGSSPVARMWLWCISVIAVEAIGIGWL